MAGEIPSADQGRAPCDHFRRHHADVFPALLTIHHSTFVCRAAVLWRITDRVWQVVLTQGPGLLVARPDE